MSSPTLEGIVVSASPNWTLELLLVQFKAVCTKTTVVVDTDSPQAQEVIKVAGRVGVDQVLPMAVGGYIETILQHVYNKVTCDWAIRLDDDELMSAPLVQAIPSLIQDGPALDGQIMNYWALSRAHISSLDPYEYIPKGTIYNQSNSLWVDYWPNVQLRLFRKGHCTHNGDLHEAPIGVGSGGVTKDYPLLHFNLLKPREERDRVTAKYKVISGPEDVRGDTALVEDYNFDTASCPYPIWIPGENPSE